MANNSLSPISRRGLLRCAILAGMVGMVGCGGEGTVEKVETPPTAGGNRSRLQKFKEKQENKGETPDPKKN
jgi:hypothetical protein